jgi:hypothetical protein
MDPSTRRTKKRAKKSILGEGQPAGRASKSAQDVSKSNFTSWRDEEELVDYEPEEPATFSPMKDDISASEKGTVALQDDPAEFPPISNNFPAYPAEATNVAGRKRSQKVLEEEETSRKTSKSIGVSAALPMGGEG